MAKESATKPRCPYLCPMCALYEAQEVVQEGIRQCVPAEVRDHLDRAAREVVLALRAFLEKGLETIVDEPKPGLRRKPQKVKVE